MAERVRGGDLRLRARRWCLLGWGVWGTCSLLAWAIWLVVKSVNATVPDVLLELGRWTIGGLGLLGLLVGVVAGALWLFNEVRAGYREPRNN